MLKVLIVEDEQIIRKGLVYTIDWISMHCSVVGDASNGEEGLRKILELQPDIVLTDIKMPKLSGIEMIERAKKEAGCEFVSIILTSYSEFEYAHKSIKLGVFEYLLKPVDEAALQTIIKNATKRIEKEKSNRLLAKRAHQTKDITFLSSECFHNPFVWGAVEEIKNHYNSKLTLESVASKLNVSVTYLNKKLKDETGSTFLEILNKYRVTKATELLNQGTMKIYEISDKTGFSNYKHFCSVFKKYTGSSPTAFIKNQ